MVGKLIVPRWSAFALTAVVVGLAVFLLAWGGIQFTRHNDRIAAVWLANGLVVAALLRQPGGRWPVLLAAALAGNVAANLVSGDALQFAAILAAFNQIEAVLVALIVAPAFKACGRIDDIRVIGRFLMAAAIGALTSGLMAAGYLNQGTGGAFLPALGSWFASDALGLLTVTPLMLAARPDEFRNLQRQWKEFVGLLLLGSVTASVVLSQTYQPLLFTLAPIIFYAALRTPLISAILVTLAISSAVLQATLNGHGIIVRINDDPTMRMYVVQLFVAVQFFTVLPIRALVSERDRFGRAAAESDRLFKRIAEASPFGLIHFDASGRPTFVNDRWMQMTGAGFDDLFNDRWLDMIEQPYRSSARSLWARARATDQPVADEFPYLNSGQRAGWAELNIFPETDGHRLLGFVARLSDVTARRVAESALVERETLYRMVTENAHDVVFRISADGLVTYVSSALERQFQIPVETMVGCPFMTIVHPDHHAEVAHLLTSDIDLSEPVAQFQVRRGDGAWVWVEAGYHSLVDEVSGQLQEMVVSMRDIDRRRQGELKVLAGAAKLKEKNRILQMAEELAEVGHWRFDFASGRLDCSRHTRRLAGKGLAARPSPLELLANVHPDDRRILLGSLARARRSEARQVLGVRVVDGDNLRHVRVGIQADLGEDGRPSGLFGIVRDKSEFIIAQEQLIEARDQAQAAARTKSHFLATMSHEIRTPMTGVLGMIDLLRDEPGGETRDRYFATLKQSADLLMAVLDDVLDFSKIDSGALKLDQVPFDLKELVASTVELFGNAASRKGLLLTFDSRSVREAAVVGDPVRIQQVVSNLISNAIKFTKHGRVQVTISDERQAEGRREWNIRVCDTGIGIDDGDISRLFQPFVQASGQSASHFGGTGLGLAISRRLVEAMRGQIGVESRVGHGSTFWVGIPLDDGDAVASPTPQGRLPQWTDGHDAKGLELLVAEDNPVNQMLIGALLRRMGHRILMVDDGKAAVEAAVGHRFDAILMDMQMPEMDGLAATRAIRGSGGASADAPIIALTADASPERRRFYNGVGLTHFMTKPIDQSQLSDLLAHIPVAPRSAGVTAGHADTAS